MKKALSVLVVLVLLAVAPAVATGEEETPTKSGAKKMKIDAVAAEALETLFERSEKAKALYDDAYGYAVFDNLKLAFIFTGGGGTGVAVKKATGDRTYMKMGTGGVGLGLGGQKYQVVFLFQDEKTFTQFVENGWQADASAKAAAGSAGANVKTGFRNGLAVYQMTDKGLMASADVAGTKYWKHKELNE